MNKCDKLKIATDKLKVYILSNNINFEYKIKELQDLISRRIFSISILGYNKEEVDNYLNNIKSRIKI